MTIVRARLGLKVLSLVRLRAHFLIELASCACYHASEDPCVSRKRERNPSQLINPHPFLFIEVKDANGTTEQWQLEMDNRSELAAIGVTATTFKPGDRVVVSGSLARARPLSLYLLRLDRPSDGFWYEQIGNTPRIRTSRS